MGKRNHYSAPRTARVGAAPGGCMLRYSPLHLFSFPAIIESQVGGRERHCIMPIATLNTGIRCYYEEAGPPGGEPLILISGACADHSEWVLQVPAFSEEFRVISFDNRGIGRSDAPADRESYSITQMAGDTMALMDALGIGRAHFIGQSMGSAIGQELALAHPERVHSLQLVVTWGRSDARIRNICHNMSILVEMGRMKDYVDYNYTHAYSPALLEAQPRLIDEIYRTMISENVHAPTRAGLLGQWHAVSRHDAMDRLSGLRVPTCVVTGEGDILVHPDYSKAVADRVPHALFHRFQGACASHLLHIEMAPLYNRLTLDFLRAYRTKE